MYEVTAGWSYLSYANHLYWTNYRDSPRPNTGWRTLTYARTYDGLDQQRTCGYIQSWPVSISIALEGGTFGCKASDWRRDGDGE